MRETLVVICPTRQVDAVRQINTTGKTDVPDSPLVHANHNETTP